MLMTSFFGFCRVLLTHLCPFYLHFLIIFIWFCSYETSNGIKADEEGELKNAGSDNEIQSAKGSFSYTAPDGQEIMITYTADENGFVPQGAHLPTPPPIPDEILKSIQLNAAEEAAGGGGGGGGNGGGGGGAGGNGYPRGNGGGGKNGYSY